MRDPHGGSADGRGGVHLAGSGRSPAGSQDRLGPTRVGGRFGWLQALADGLKLITKEDLVPAEADALLFRLAPYISFCASFAVYLALPFADGWVGQRLNTAVFFILAVAGLEVFGVILGGYASGSKWSLFGGHAGGGPGGQLRGALGTHGRGARAGGREHGTRSPSARCSRAGSPPGSIFPRPLHVPHLLRRTSTLAVASVNRAPFDLAEAESELVGRFSHRVFGLPLVPRSSWPNTLR